MGFGTKKMSKDVPSSKGPLNRCRPNISYPTEIRANPGDRRSTDRPRQERERFLDPDGLCDHRAKSLANVFQKTGVLLDEFPSHPGRKVDVPIPLNDLEHRRVAEDCEQILELIVRQRREALVDGEVLPQFLPDRPRPSLVVAVHHPRGVVPRLEGLSRSVRGEVRTMQARENPTAARRLRLTCRVSYDHHVVRMAPARESERDAARNVQDRLGSFRVLPHNGLLEHLLEVRVCIPLADAQPDPRRVPARDDPSEEPRGEPVPYEQLHGPRVPGPPVHLDLEPGEDLPRPKDVEPLCDARANAVATDENLPSEGSGGSVPIDAELDSTIDPRRSLGLRADERVGPGPDRLGHDRAIEHRSIHDDGLCLPPVDPDPPPFRRVDFRASDLPEDRLLA